MALEVRQCLQCTSSGCLEEVRYAIEHFGNSIDLQLTAVVFSFTSSSPGCRGRRRELRLRSWQHLIFKANARRPRLFFFVALFARVVYLDALHTLTLRTGSDPV
jgi:hypothetical protein